MSKYYKKSGSLKLRYTLKNVIRNKGRSLEVNIPRDMVYALSIRFQGRRFRFKEAVDKLQRSNVSEVEILPGIYIAYRNNNKVVRLVIDIMTRRFHFVIKNLNARDSFYIESDLETKIRRSTYETKIISHKIENIDPMEVEQPVNLGGGECGGCNILRYFSMLQLNGEASGNAYYFFSDRELLEATKSEEFFLELCRENLCYKTYQLIVAHGYRDDLDKHDQIRIGYINGVYSVDEGKHRICTMKRFGYNQKIPMLVTRREEYGECIDPFIPYGYDNMERVLESCYENYRRIGISDECVRHNLQNPEATVLDYLKSSEYDYAEMYERCDPYHI